MDERGRPDDARGGEEGQGSPEKVDRMAGCGDTFMELEQELHNQAMSHDLQNQSMMLNANNEENIEDVNAIDHQLRAAYFMEKNG